MTHIISQLDFASRLLLIIQQVRWMESMEADHKKEIIKTAFLDNIPIVFGNDAVKEIETIHEGDKPYLNDIDLALFQILNMAQNVVAAPTREDIKNVTVNFFEYSNNLWAATEKAGIKFE